MTTAGHGIVMIRIISMESMWAHNDSFDGVRPGSQLLTGTAHVRFNSIESRDSFLGYFDINSVMHYDRVLRARMSKSEMQPRKALTPSYDQSVFGACRFGDKIYDCSYGRDRTTQDKVNHCCPPHHPMRIAASRLTRNWTDNVVRECSARRHLQW